MNILERNEYLGMIVSIAFKYWQVLQGKSRSEKEIVVAIHVRQDQSSFFFSSYYNWTGVILLPWFDERKTKSIRSFSPTCLLFDSEKKLKAFGFDAQKEYRKLDEVQKQDVLYFQDVDVWKCNVRVLFTLNAILVIPLHLPSLSL